MFADIRLTVPQQICDSENQFIIQTDKVPRDPIQLTSVETDLLFMASLQLTALKSLGVILTCNKYVEMLLVPNSDDEIKQSKSDTLTDSDMQEIVRSILKQMVKRAVMPSPIKRSCTLAELERAHSLLQKVAISCQVEDQTGIKTVRGKYSP